jgi:hypothetical protein
MPDEKDQSTADETEEGTPDTSQHAYKEGREEDVEGSIPSGDRDPEEATNTGGATSGGPPRKAGDEPEEDPSEVEHDA